jgi:hypothetical protein
MLIKKYFPELANADPNTLNIFFFYGLLPGMTYNNCFISGIISQFNYAVSSQKLQKKMTPIGIFFEDLNLSIYKLLKMSNKICEVKQNLDLYLCRHTFNPP